MTASSTRPTPGGGLAALAVFLGVSFAVAAIGGSVTATSVGSWYAGLAKPGFNPPNGVFGPVWTALYVTMAVAAWRVWRTGAPGRRRALGLWGAQLALNLGWSCLFFGLRSPALALGEIVLLWAAIAATLVGFARLDRTAAWLMAPYLAWVSFAAVLNYEVWRLN